MRNFVPAVEEQLECCIEALQTGQASIEECLAGPAVDRAAIEPLLLTAQRLDQSLKQAHAVGMTPERQAAASLRMRNLVAAHPRTRANGGAGRQTSGKAATWAERWRRPALALASLLLLVVLLTSGIVAASANALPGDTLYSTKRAFENVQLTLSGSQQTGGQLRLDFSDRRLDEAARLRENGQVEQMRGALQNYAAEVQAALALLADQDGLSEIERDRMLNLVNLRLEAQEARLSDWLDTAADVDRGEIQAAITASQAARQQVRELLDSRLVILPTGSPTHTPTLSNSPTGAPSATPAPPTAASGWSQGWSTIYPPPGAFRTSTPSLRATLEARATAASEDGSRPRDWLRDLLPTLKAAPTRLREAIQTARPEGTRPPRTPGRPREELPRP